MFFLVTEAETGNFVNVVQVREKNLAKAAAYLPEMALKGLVLSALGITAEGYGFHNVTEISPVTI